MKDDFNKSLIGVPAAIISALIAALIAAVIINGPTTSGAVPSAKPDEMTATSTQTLGPNAAESATPEQPNSPPIATDVPATSLTVDGAVGSRRCMPEGNSGNPWKSEIGPIGGISYTKGISCRVAQDNAWGQLDYLVPADAANFVVVAGQLDSAGNTTLVARFEVLDVISGKILSSHDLAYGQSAQIDIPVTGLLRIAMRASLLTSGTPPSETYGIFGWAEPTFR